MRLLVWNIRAGGGRRIERIFAEIAALEPDICGFSEFRATPPSCWLAAQLAELGYRHQRAAAAATRRQNIVFVASKYPLRVTRSAAAPREPGRWLSLRVAAPDPFHLGLVHIPNESSGRKDDFLDSVLQVARRWRNERAIIAGDTNSGRPLIDEENAVFDERYTRWFDRLDQMDWSDGFRSVHGQRREYTWYSPQKDNGFRLDQAFVSKALQNRLLGVQHKWAGAEPGGRRDAISDHAAVVVDLG